VNGYWIGPLFTLLCALAFIAYWVRRFGHEHRERMARIEASATDYEQEFEAKKKAWAEQQTEAKARYTARAAEITLAELGTVPQLASVPISSPSASAQSLVSDIGARQEQEVVELPLLLPLWQALELEAAARRRGMTTGQMLRRVIGELLGDQPAEPPTPSSERNERIQQTTVRSE